MEPKNETCSQSSVSPASFRPRGELARREKIASHSSLSFLLLIVKGRLLRSRDWSVLSIYTLRQFCSISLSCDPTRTLVNLRIGKVRFEYSPTSHPLDRLGIINLFLFIHSLQILPLCSFIFKRQRGLHGCSDVFSLATGQETVPDVYKTWTGVHGRGPPHGPGP